MSNLSQPALANLEARVFELGAELRQHGIAHGDLQHGNILVSAGELRLVDYDGMYVPAMRGLASNELGHRNYQHPRRNATHFSSTTDNFSTWVIWGSIRALNCDPSLSSTLGVGDDCLLFKQTDFATPDRSPVFATLEHHENSDIQRLGRFIRHALTLSPDAVPHIQTPIPEVTSLIEISRRYDVRFHGTCETLPGSAPGSSTEDQSILRAWPDWLHGHTPSENAPYASRRWEDLEAKAAVSRQELFEAAERGEPDAQYKLGLLYQLGEGGLQQNWDVANMWFEKAVWAGHRGAVAALAASGSLSQARTAHKNSTQTIGVPTALAQHNAQPPAPVAILSKAFEVVFEFGIAVAFCGYLLYMLICGCLGLILAGIEFLGGRSITSVIWPHLPVVAGTMTAIIIMWGFVSPRLPNLRVSKNKP